MNKINHIKIDKLELNKQNKYKFKCLQKKQMKK